MKNPISLWPYILLLLIALVFTGAVAHLKDDINQINRAFHHQLN